MRIILLMLVPFVLLIGCSDNNSGDNSFPAPPRVNELLLETDLEAAQVISQGDMMASGSLEFRLNEDDGSVSGEVNLSGIEAQAVSLNHGYAGARGPVLVALEQSSPMRWSIPNGTVFEPTDRDRLEAGEIYVFVTAENFPDGALRAQLLTDNVGLVITRLSGAQMVPTAASMASGVGYLTINNTNNRFAVHVNTLGAEDALMAHVHNALAGLNGGVLIDLIQDPNNPAHWMSEGMELTDMERSAFSAGELYYVVHTPAFPAGAIRGQIAPDNLEIEFTRLTGADVVTPGMMGVMTDALAYAATTVAPETRSLTLHLNTEMLPDATGASINWASIGQNGPVVAALQQDANNSAHWFLEDLVLTEEQYDALRDQSLYFQVANPAWPAGLIRGQWLPENSMQGDGSGFVVLSLNPASGAELAEFPIQLSVELSESLGNSNLDPVQVEILASGGDGSFSEGNEIELTPLQLTAMNNVLSIDTTAVMGGVDTFQLRLRGSGATPLADQFGNLLDGDLDGNPGGDFISTFMVLEQMEPMVTFSFIQENIFTPNCTNAGCHSGASPAAGQNLTAGQAFANIVGVASSEVPMLSRIEPGDPDNSYLVQKLEGTAQVGSRMPLGAPPLSNELIQALRKWVSEGAPNN